MPMEDAKEANKKKREGVVWPDWEAEKSKIPKRDQEDLFSLGQGANFSLFLLPQNYIYLASLLSVM